MGVLLKGIAGLAGSKKAVAGGGILICATVLCALGRMSVEQWQELATWVFGIYVAGETANGVTAMVTSKPTPAPGTTVKQTTEVTEVSSKE